MLNKILIPLLLFILLNTSCSNNKVNQNQQNEDQQNSSHKIGYQNEQKNSSPILFKDGIDTKDVKPKDLITFAKTLIGIPYKYGSTNIEKGFDCSGFITYVFNHFQIAVPRSSIDFTNVAKEVNLSKSKPGDLILFTGTDSTKRIVGHMGIITQTIDTIKFIHSTSGKAYGVTETPLNKYYQGRFVKTIRIFE